jgi:hypothetical protein
MDPEHRRFQHDCLARYLTDDASLDNVLRRVQTAVKTYCGRVGRPQGLNSNMVELCRLVELPFTRPHDLLLTLFGGDIGSISTSPFTVLSP